MRNYDNRNASFNPASSAQTMGHDFVTGNQTQSLIEEKVAHLSLQLNQIIIKPYLQQALDYLKSSKFDAINAYNRLSDQIGNEVRIISHNIDEITSKIATCQETINRTQEVIRNKYSNASEEEISSGELNLEYEYNIVAEHYEMSLQLTHEISKYKSRIDNLLSTQGLLDESSVPAVNRIQLEVDNLELLLHNLDSTDYAEALAKKQGRKNVVSKKHNKESAMQGRQASLNEYAQQLNNNNLDKMNTIGSGPDLKNMNRYEDPNGIELKTKKYPFDDTSVINEQLQGLEEERLNKKNSKQRMYKKDNIQKEHELNDQLMSINEVKVQKKLYKQERKLQRMKMKNEYQQQLDQIKFEQSKVNAMKKAERMRLDSASTGDESVNSDFPNKETKKSLFSKQKRLETTQGRFANVQEEEAAISNAKQALDSYDEYLTRTMQDSGLERAFDKEVEADRSIKVIR